MNSEIKNVYARINTKIVTGQQMLAKAPGIESFFIVSFLSINFTVRNILLGSIKGLRQTKHYGKTALRYA